MRQRKRDMVDRLIAAHMKNYNESGAELIMGNGRFVAPKTLEVSLNDGGDAHADRAQVFSMWERTQPSRIYPASRPRSR